MPWARSSLGLLTLLCCLMLNQQTAASPIVDWQQAAQALGVPGREVGDGGYLVRLLRNDIKFTIKASPINAALVANSFVAFHCAPGTVPEQCSTRGMLTLTPDELPPAIEELQRGGLSIDAISQHVHFVRPRILNVYFSAKGHPLQLAKALKHALNKARISDSDLLDGSFARAAESVTRQSKTIEGLLGHPTEGGDGFLVFNIARAEAVMEDGVELLPYMGTASIIAFLPMERGRSLMIGSLALLASEIEPVVRVLVNAGIEITGLHNRMRSEQPRLFFLGLSAGGSSMALARALRTALELTNTQRPLVQSQRRFAQGF